MENSLDLLKCIIIELVPDFAPQDITLETDLLNDLSLDSIIFIKMIINIESVFNISIDDEYLLIEKLRKVSYILDVINIALSSGEDHE